MRRSRQRGLIKELAYCRHDCVRCARHIDPGESNHSPSVKKRLSIALAIYGEGLSHLVPAPRIPLNCQMLAGICRIEPPIHAPRNRVLELRFRQASVSQNISTDTFERCSVSWTGLTILEDPPDLPDSRFALSSDLIDNCLHIRNAGAPISDSGPNHSSEVSNREEPRQVDDRSRHRCNREVVDRYDVFIKKIVTPMNNHAGKLMGCSGVDEDGGHPTA